MQYQFAPFKEEVKKISDWLSREYMNIHTGKASPAILDSINVESYGSFMPVKNVASIAIEDPKTLRVAPWDKSQIKGIEKAIQAADLGLSVAADADGLRVIFPMLTTENREKLVKVVKAKLEDARISLRQEREKVQRDIEEKAKAGEMSEDDKFRAKEDLQKIIDEGNGSLESIFTRKESDIMSQ